MSPPGTAKCLAEPEEARPAAWPAKRLGLDGDEQIANAAHPETGDELNTKNSVTIEPEVGLRFSSEDGSELSVDRILSSVKNSPTGKQNLRWQARRIVLSTQFQVFMVLVLLLDAALFITTTVHNAQDRELSPAFGIADHFTLVLYSIEVILGMYGFGWRNFARDCWNILDIIVLSASTVISLLDSGPLSTLIFVRALKFGKQCKLLKFVGRGLRCVHLLHRTREQTPRAMRTIVSKNKFRYLDLTNNIDLDLTYITKELIAMGVPVSGCIHSTYRNPQSDVVRFFKGRHFTHFRIYNVCPELPYPDKPFRKIGGSVVRFQVADHTPPTMDQFIDFLQDTREFRLRDQRNTIAVHCKAGKGRTGSLCCAWLIYSRRCKSADDALELFARRRTDQRYNGRLRGVETPSQVRYIRHLFQHLEKTGSWITSPLPPQEAPAPTLRLLQLEFGPGFLAKPRRLEPLRVLVQWGDAATGRDCFKEIPNIEPNSLSTIDLDGVLVMADVRICLFEGRSNELFVAKKSITSARNPFRVKGLLVFFAFHTGFVGMLEEEKGRCRILAEDLDKGQKRIKQGLVSRGSFVKLHFDLVGATSAFCWEPEVVVV